MYHPAPPSPFTFSTPLSQGWEAHLVRLVLMQVLGNAYMYLILMLFMTSALHCPTVLNVFVQLMLTQQDSILSYIYS